MNTASIKVDDIVKVNMRGRVFHAIVTGIPTDDESRGVTRPRQFDIRPLDRGITWRHCTSRQIVAAWYKSRQSNGGNA